MKEKQSECPSPAQGVGVRQACFCLGVFWAFMLLFNGVAMSTSASRLEYGKTRDFWMTVLRPVERVSRMTGLWRLRSWTETAWGGWLNRTSHK